MAERVCAIMSSAKSDVFMYSIVSIIILYFSGSFARSPLGVLLALPGVTAFGEPAGAGDCARSSVTSASETEVIKKICLFIALLSSIRRVVASLQ